MRLPGARIYNLHEVHHGLPIQRPGSWLLDSMRSQPHNDLMLIFRMADSFRAFSHCSCRFGILPILTMFFCSLVAQQPESRPLSVRDLEIGMPRDYVLARLLATYTLTDERTMKAPSSDSLDKYEFVSVFQGDQPLGELYFDGGKLQSATISIYQSSQCDFELLDELFQSIYDNSGQYKKIAEEPGGGWTRTRIEQVSVVSVEKDNGIHRWKTLQFNVGEKWFDMEIRSLSGNSDPKHRFVTLEERITKKWQGDSKQKTPIK